MYTFGFSLFAEGWGFKIPKEYLYAAIVFSVMIETLNQIASRNCVKRAAAGNLRSRTADAILRLLGGARGGETIEDVSSIFAAGSAAQVFAPAERNIVRRVRNLAQRPVKSIMTPASDVVWLIPAPCRGGFCRRGTQLIRYAGEGYTI